MVKKFSLSDLEAKIDLLHKEKSVRELSLEEWRDLRRYQRQYKDLQSYEIKTKGGYRGERFNFRERSQRRIGYFGGSGW